MELKSAAINEMNRNQGIMNDTKHQSKKPILRKVQRKCHF